jgi:hypothetical protein
MRKKRGIFAGARLFVWLALALLFALGGGSCGEIRRDELYCEEAVSRLIDCCPGLDPRLLPCVNADGCSGSISPSLSLRSSTCVLDRSCTALQSGGVCARAIDGSRLPSAYKGENSKFDTELCR